jgi:hypothetical protein
VQKARCCSCIGKPIAGRVRIDIQLYPQRPQDWAKRARLAPLTWDDDVRCIDLDNANKVLLDALKGVAIEDDRWVRELHSQRMEPDGEARVVVTITPRDFSVMTSMRRQRAATPHVTAPSRTGATKRIWLLLCAEGGNWSAPEIRAKLGITGPINTMLRDMVSWGSIMQRRLTTVDGEKVVKYGVAHNSKVPRGVTWEEIEQLRRDLKGPP